MSTNLWKPGRKKTISMWLHNNNYCTLSDVYRYPKNIFNKLNMLLMFVYFIKPSMIKLTIYIHQYTCIMWIVHTHLERVTNECLISTTFVFHHLLYCRCHPRLKVIPILCSLYVHTGYIQNALNNQSERTRKAKYND